MSHILNKQMFMLEQDALALVINHYREGIRPGFQNWLQARWEALGLRYDTATMDVLHRALHTYREQVSQLDTRYETLFKVSRERLLREKGIECPDSVSMREVGNTLWLEYNIAYGYAALAWQVVHFPHDILLTPHAIANRYPNPTVAAIN